MASGSFFGNGISPQSRWKVGSTSGTAGTVEISDLMFEVKGPCPGAIIIERNIKIATPAATGIWDPHWRTGGSAGTNLQQDKCLKNPAHPFAPGDPICLPAKALSCYCTLHHKRMDTSRIPGNGSLITSRTWARKIKSPSSIRQRLSQSPLQGLD
jgi:hypothetical protein